MQSLRRGASGYLAVGLGNPGPEYAGNRHNVGFQCIDHLAEVHNIRVRRKRHNALLGEGLIARHRVVLAKPQTFMNDSGNAVGPISHQYRIPPQRILAIHDDLDLPLGRWRLRPDGSGGGHRGVASMIDALGTFEFCRLRIGVGRPHLDNQPSSASPGSLVERRRASIDYVLDDFCDEELATVRAVYTWVDKIVRSLVTNGVRETMNAYNGVRLGPQTLDYG